MNSNLELENIRSVLIRQEETIIFALVERAQFNQNKITYQPGGITIPDYNGSFVDYLLYGTEALHATVRRYTSPDEHSFFKNLPEPVLPAQDYDYPIKKVEININDKIYNIYKNEIIPAICALGDDGQYGSSAVCDVACLQALSKRIHYGKFVAESKFLLDKDEYLSLIKAGNRDGLINKLTVPEVEDKLLKRVIAKAATYGREIDGSDSEPEQNTPRPADAVHPSQEGNYTPRPADAVHPSPEGNSTDNENPKLKISSALVADIYKKWIIPLTIEVEVEYLLALGKEY